MAAERLSVQADSLTAQALLMNELLNSAIEPVFAAQGLRTNTFDLLSTIHVAGPDATQAEIARRLGVKPPSLTEALRGVKHLIEQVPSATDNRVKHLQLTKQGHEALKECVKAVDRISKAITAGIEKDQLKIAIEVLRKCNRMLSQTTGLVR
jgi:DNA-binding MarR family transcriptional regulator